MLLGVLLDCNLGDCYHRMRAICALVERHKDLQKHFTDRELAGNRVTGLEYFMCNVPQNADAKKTFLKILFLSFLHSDSSLFSTASGERGGSPSASWEQNRMRPVGVRHRHGSQL